MKLTRREFIKYSAYSSFLITSVGLNGCDSDNNSDPLPSRTYTFDHGVASGDPLAESVVIWTRVTPDTNDDATVSWEVATDSAFTQLVNSDSASVGAERDFTVKVDVQGLAAGSIYYYRFKAGDTYSATGRTKTLPGLNAEKLKMAVVSCANYPAGYFHVYDLIAQQDDVDVVLHLGDYIYEYGLKDKDGSPAYASEDAATLGRESNPPTDCLSLNDYRTRYAQYRSDPHLQSVHARHPFIAVWDDHEIVNDSYKTGGENHNDETQGNFSTRKLAAIQAYFEWIPLRPLTPDAEGRIYRQFEVGSLVNLLMLDTRNFGRDKQLDYVNYIDPNTGNFDAESFTADVSSNSRSILGSEQRTWLTDKMSASTATWQVLGQQVLMMRMLLPAVTLTPTPENPTVSLGEYGEIATAAITFQTLVANGVNPANPDDLIAAGMTQSQLDIVNDPVKMNYLKSPSIPYNLDAWDGYAYDREVILGTAKAAQKNLVTLAGDTHNAWGGRLTDLEANNVGVELACSSVSSPGLEEYLDLPDATAARQTEAGIQQLVADLDYSNVRERGYLTVEFTTDEAKAEWRFIKSVKQDNYELDNGLTKKVSIQAGTSALV